LSRERFSNRRRVRENAEATGTAGCRGGLPGVLAELPYGDGYLQDPRVIRAYEYSDRAGWVLYLQVVVGLAGLWSLTKVDWQRRWGIYAVIAVHIWAALFVG
jgi:hypothetical protein